MRKIPHFILIYSWRPFHVKIPAEETITNTVVNTLGLALNNRGIYRATIIDTIDNGVGLDIEFKRPNQYYPGSIASWVLGEEISPEESRALVARISKMPRKRIAIRATTIK